MIIQLIYKTHGLYKNIVYGDRITNWIPYDTNVLNPDYRFVHYNF